MRVGLFCFQEDEVNFCVRFLIVIVCVLVSPVPARAELFSSKGQMGRLPKGSGSCRAHLAEAHGGASKDPRGAMEREIRAFQSMAERALALRAETIKVGLRLREKAENDLPLSGRELTFLNQGIREHLGLRQEMLALAEAHECWLDLPARELAAAGIDPEVHLQGIMLSLSSALVLYDNYLLAVSLFEGDPKLRRLLNERDPGYAIQRAELNKITLNYNSVNNRNRVRRAMAFYEREMKRRLKRFPAGSGADYLSALIAQSPSYGMIRKVSPLYVLGRKLGFMGALTFDTVAGLEREGVTAFSMVFGNAMGLVETRKGKLYRRSEVLSELQGRLKSGDILLEKTPFRLTDKLIPGYWGHAAVWIGTEAELRELGIWDHAIVVPHRNAVREGRLIVEALRSGVEMNSLEHFLNIDSIGILRLRNLSREERSRVVVEALRQVGKPYDFNFDVESKERVYCSKLVYFTHGAVAWPTRKSMGRTTFTPDDVAALAVNGGELELVDFYHDGEPVVERPLARMAELMGVAAGDGGGGERVR